MGPVSLVILTVFAGIFVGCCLMEAANRCLEYADRDL